MAVINNAAPAPASDSGGMGFLLGVITLIVFVFLMMVYGLPILRNAVGSSSPQINVPDKVNVDVKQAK